MAIFVCPDNHSDCDLIDNKNKISALFPKKEKKKNIKILKFTGKIIDSVRDFLRNFFKITKILFTGKNKDTVYVAAIFYAGLGDMVRYKAVILELIKMYPDIVIDIYNKSSTAIFKDMRNVRFFLNIDAVNMIKKYYDIVYKFDYFTAYPMVMKKGRELTDKVSENLSVYREKYPVCFNRTHAYDNDNLIESGINIINLLKITSGVDNIEDTSFSIKPDNISLSKFGIDDNASYLTFQCGVGGSGTLDNARCWSLEKWNSLLIILKEKLNKNIKFIQVGTGGHDLPEADINLSGKTSLEELFCVLKKSLFHIDIDGACSHFARALGTKSLVIFGPTDAFFIGYTENINITSSLCRGCWSSNCQLGYGKLCMESITPEFVVDKVVEYIKTLDIENIKQ